MAAASSALRWAKTKLAPAKTISTSATRPVTRKKGRAEIGSAIVGNDLRFLGAPHQPHDTHEIDDADEEAVERAVIGAAALARAMVDRHREDASARALHQRR